MIAGEPLKTRTPEPQTALLKDAAVPADPRVQEAVRAACRDRAAAVNAPLMGETELAQRAGDLLRALDLPSSHRLYAMVELHNAITWPFFTRVPYHERLLLLPHCLRDDEACQGILAQGILECRHCGRCGISDLVQAARRLGYSVLVSEDASSVLETLMATGARSVLGVSCLKTLWKVFPWVAQFGLYGQAIPLLRDGCKNTAVDAGRVRRVLEALDPSTVGRDAPESGEPAPFRPIFARMLALLGEPGDDTERIAREWVSCGGKRVRSFLVVCIYTILSKSREIPDSVLKVALAIELFHKASLIHDDIEDQELTRYGRPTLHRRFGIPVAINTGDYLVGKGYELIASAAGELGPERTAAVARNLSETHVRVTRGQGEELLWTRGEDKQLDRRQVEAIYALKTAPFFEIAGRLGLILAGKEDDGRALASFAHHMGVSYQILDDLGDYRPGDNGAGETIKDDIRAGKPTILLALAQELGAPAERSRLLDLYGRDRRTDADLSEVLAIFDRSGAVERAYAECRTHYRAALSALEAVSEVRLRRLLADLVEYRLGRKLPGRAG
jgi:geranylgeranyl pyrophosphate synthase